MSTLKDVNYSLQGEVQKNEKKSKDTKDIPGIIFYNYDKPVADKEWYIFKLVDNSKSGGVYIPNIDDVYNPATKEVERIRLLSGVNTIWQKEQKDITENYVKQNMRSIEFPRGVKIRRVAAHDKTMLQFMRLSNANVGNPKRVKTSRFEFYEYDAAAAEKEQFEREELEFQMETLARNAKLEPMKKHAAFLGIRLINELGEPKSQEGIRREYARYAKTNPAYFKKTMNTQEVELNWLVKKAILDSMIDIGREDGKIYWAKGGELICAYPQGVNPEKHLTDLALTNTEEGNRFKEYLKQLGT